MIGFFVLGFMVWIFCHCCLRLGLLYGRPDQSFYLSEVVRLGCTINPTLYSAKEFAGRKQTEKAFFTRVLAQPKLWLIGADEDNIYVTRR